MYKHIIWDFDGTLFDTYAVMAKAAQLTLQEYGWDEPLEDIIRLMKISMPHAFNYFSQKYPTDEAFIESYENRRRRMELKECKPYPGVVEICKYIHETGRYNYINTHRGISTYQFLKDYHLEEYFRESVTSQNGLERKPSPQAIEYLMEKYKIKPEEAIMIGDRELDILAGKNAGISACFFDDQGGKCPVADCNIKDIQQLYKIIDDSI